LSNRVGLVGLVHLVDFEALLNPAAQESVFVTQSLDLLCGLGEPGM
jgi:hypothetical protein